MVRLSPCTTTGKEAEQWHPREVERELILHINLIPKEKNNLILILQIQRNDKVVSLYDYQKGS